MMNEVKILTPEKLMELIKNKKPKDLTDEELKRVLSTVMKGMSAGFDDTTEQISAVCEGSQKIEINRVLLPINYMYESYSILRKAILEINYRADRLSDAQPPTNTKH